jgi:hypothetical protein
MITHTILLAFIVALVPLQGGQPYANAEYGFAFTVPAGVDVVKADASAPDHGVRMNLTPEGRSFAWVDGSYNALDWQSDDDVVAANLDYLKDDGATDIAVAHRAKTQLGALPALDLLVNYTDARHRPSVLRVVVAIRKPAKGDAPDIVYTVGMQTAQDRAAADAKVFDAIVASFRTAEPS